MDKAAKLTKDTSKLTLFQRFKSRIFELLNRNRYGEFMKSLRSKEGLTIDVTTYKIIEIEGKKFIQMTDKN